MPRGHKDQIASDTRDGQGLASMTVLFGAADNSRLVAKTPARILGDETMVLMGRMHDGARRPCIQGRHPSRTHDGTDMPAVPPFVKE